MPQRQLSCIVFMPFRDDLSFVYELGIKPALEELSARMQYRSFSPERADEYMVLDADKVSMVIESLTRSDLVITDITHYNPNVLWELGYSHALGKPVVILSQSEDIPFNIKTRDFLHYDFSMEGMEKLRDELVAKLLPIVETMVVPLRYDPDINRIFQAISNGLGTLERDSILKNLVRNELRRLESRIQTLQDGQFELRNEKPNSEIIDYFCDYVTQLCSPGSQYDTISTDEFWKAITDDGTNYDYLTANVDAARAGAHIRRVFLLDGRRFAENSVRSDLLFSDILQEHYDKTRGLGSAMETRVFFSPSYVSDLRFSQNFAIWRKGTEVMLFVPGYERPDANRTERKLSKTRFYYYDEDRLGLASFNRNKAEIDRHGSRFADLWERGVPLAPEHFE